MIPLINHDSRVRENSEVVIMYPDIYPYGPVTSPPMIWADVVTSPPKTIPTVKSPWIGATDHHPQMLGLLGLLP